MGFEYLDHPLSYKYAKDQLIVVLKGRPRWLKKKIKKVKLDCEIAWKHMGTTDQCFEVGEQCWKTYPNVKDSCNSKDCITSWISRWPWFQGMSSTNFQIVYHVKIIVFHTCSLVDFDFAIFHLEGISNEKVYIGGDSKRMWKGEKFQVQKAWVGGGQG